MSKDTKKYGKSEADIQTKKMIECRDIVKTIIDFGVDETQKKQIIKLLSLELESNLIMKEIAEILKKDKENKPKSLIYID
jgi:hypothetical protein